MSYESSDRPASALSLVASKVLHIVSSEYVFNVLCSACQQRFTAQQPCLEGLSFKKLSLIIFIVLWALKKWL